MVGSFPFLLAWHNWTESRFDILNDARSHISVIHSDFDIICVSCIEHRRHTVYIRFDVVNTFALFIFLWRMHLRFEMSKCDERSVRFGFISNQINKFHRNMCDDTHLN